MYFLCTWKDGPTIIPRLCAADRMDMWKVRSCWKVADDTYARIGAAFAAGREKTNSKVWSHFQVTESLNILVLVVVPFWETKCVVFIKRGAILGYMLHTPQ